MQQTDKVINSFFWKAGERVMVQGVSFIVQIILARLLMPEDFASLAIISAIVGFLGLFVQSGLSVAVVQKKELTDDDIATLTSISLIIALVLFILLYVFAQSISDYYNVGDLVWPIRVMGISLFLYSFNSIQTGLLTRRMQFKTIFYRSLIATPLSGFIGILLAYLGFGIWALVVYNIANILLIVIFMNFIPDLRLKIGYSKSSARDLYSFSLKILGSNIICSAGDTVRTLTIGKVYNPNQLAYFERGLTYSNLVTGAVSSSITSVLLPAFSRSQDEIDKLRRMAINSVGVSSFIMIPILVLVATMSKPLVLIIFSEKWVPFAIYLSIFCIMRIPGFITSIDKQVYYAMGNSQICLYYEIGMLLANLLALFLVLSKGVLAIAIVFTVVEYVGNFLLFFISQKEYGFSLRDRFNVLFPTLFGSLIMAIAVYSMNFCIHNIWILVCSQLLIGVLVYMSISFILNKSYLLLVFDLIINKLHNKKKL